MADQIVYLFEMEYRPAIFKLDSISTSWNFPVNDTHESHERKEISIEIENVDAFYNDHFDFILKKWANLHFRVIFQKGLHMRIIRNLLVCYYYLTNYMSLILFGVSICGDTFEFRSFQRWILSLSLLIPETYFVITDRFARICFAFCHTFCVFPPQ